ncbi:phage integrase [Gilliamella apis]|uniref:phage integrase n=1 Tax=Gilliamella apis TaxID=1970738 RepID=UPI004037EAB1
MLFISKSINNPLANKFTSKIFTDYRTKRLNGEIYRPERVKTVVPRTLNLELAYIKSMFNN